ncbi:hypothetical protein [Nesterenkonia halotolerans]|uniref:Cyanophycin synthetase n=1 Tax=Nesterenkonia halotolerans TaxID=225325 RepID=A0ABR9J328_9MICC|nr:hypothetical protein [Nesterenkonia halotolerans]MBE1513388.1 cyanophycin synthetase [Nesterenkonia halotolerans]
MTDASGADLNTGPAMNPHVTEFLRSFGRETPVDFGGRRADSPSALLSGAARRNKFRLSKVQNNHYVITGGRRVIGGFAVHLTSLPSAEALRASMSLPLAKRHLQLEGLPVPPGAHFDVDHLEKAIAHFKGLTKAAVVKPAASTHGAGSTTGITTEREFRDAWTAAASARRSDADADQRLIVEDHVEGLDVRAFVVGENVVAANARVPLFCIGDGSRTLREQVEEVSARRSAHPLFGKFDHDAWGYAIETGLPLDSRTEKDRVYQLSPGINMRAGGVTVDVTDHMGSALKDLAVAATWAIPGCKAAAVDLLLPDISSVEGATILDVDVQAGFATHHYPWIGSRRQVADALIKKMHENSRG